jgi:prepilin-type N-terminal cleavage/methylation domain-containing protein
MLKHAYPVQDLKKGRSIMADRKPVLSGKIHSDQGFTLIEVLLAMLCFSLVALALSSTSIQTWHDNAFVKSASEANVLASRVVEELRLLKYQDDAIADGQHTVTIDGHEVIYSISDDSILPRTKAVAIQVAYSRKGVAKTLTFDHILPMIVR